jgi:hypothetical protein
MTKLCPKGHSYIPPQSPKGCKDCKSAWNKKWYISHPEVLRNQTLRKYGLTYAEFELLLAQQNFGCAMCGTKIPGGRGTFHVDHNHKTGRIRGLLCSTCNHKLGVLENSVWMDLAMTYLRVYGTR